MTDLFASARSVLRRADHHITDMTSHLKIFIPDKPYTHVIEQDTETGDYLHILRFSPDFSDDISCILFDAINNLRACLDHMTYAIAVKHRGQSDRFAYFPFADELIRWPDRIKGMKNDIPPEIATLFESFKPYKGGNNTLWAVNYLANVKKHALLVPVWFGGTTVKIPAGTTVPPFAVTPADRAKKDEIVIFRSAEPPQRHPNIEITYSIIIDHPEEVIQGKSPITFLNAMRREVGCVLMATEAECQRIGLLT